MEMPIELIITLMIVLVVGALIITFSQTIIGNAENQLPQLDDSKSQDTQILEVATITNAQIGMLVDECFKNRFGKVFKQETCFIIHSNSPYEIGEVDDINSYTTNKSALGNVASGSEVNTVLIIWDFANTNVEVSA